MVNIKTYSSRFDAELARDILEKAGIPSIISTEDCGSWYPFRFASPQVQLLVEDSEGSEALKVLEEYYNPDESGKTSPQDKESHVEKDE